MKRIRYCDDCDESREASHKFCYKCGSGLTEVVDTCEKCGFKTEIDPDNVMRYCPMCGEGLGFEIDKDEED